MTATAVFLFSFFAFYYWVKFLTHLIKALK